MTAGDAAVAGRDAGVGAGPCVVSVVVPTRNEAPNIELLEQRLAAALASTGGGWELIFVDDSDDSTPQVAAALMRAGRPVRLVHREKGDRRGGLGGAVQEGFKLARGTVVVVMDADLQHPPEVVPALVAPLLSGDAALVAGSRYGWAGGDAGLAGLWRPLLSRACRALVHALVPASRPLEDPMSGLFAFQRAGLDGVQLRPAGYKILLEVTVRARPSPVHNVGFDFAPRHAGRSKATVREGLVFAGHLARLVVVNRRQGPAGPSRPAHLGAAPPGGDVARDGAQA